MNATQNSIDWFAAFDAVCRRSTDALEWGLPEPWVHAELYAELKRCAGKTGWHPLPQEIPYVTFYPVQLPSESNRDWKVHGAVKWSDLCLRNASENAWYWFEFKVRHAGTDGRQLKAAKAALDAFRKDVIALVGFSSTLTAQTWTAPDEFTRIYWAETLLKPHAQLMAAGTQHFVAAYLQLNGDFSDELWSETQFRRELESWLAQRRKPSEQKRDLPPMAISFSTSLLSDRHSLLVCRWTVPSGSI